MLIASKLPRCELNGEVDAGVISVESEKGKRCREASGKVTVFGLLKRSGKVVIAIVPNTRAETLLPIIEERVTLDSIVYTDTFKACNELDVTEFHHMCMNHLKLFPDREIKSTGSKTLVTNPSDICEDLMASIHNHSIGFLRSVNGMSMD